MSLDYQAVVTTSVAKQISESIRQAILEGRLKTGERLPTEDDLAQRYGVSRPTIREALKRLAAQNLVRSRRGPTGGNFIASPNPEEIAQSVTGAAMLMVSLGGFDFSEIATARLEFETLCCRLAATNRTENHLERMRAALQEQRDKSITDEEFCAADVRFHRALVEATGNGPISFMMYAIVEAMLPVANMAIFRVRERQSIVAFHERILDGVAGKDAAAAVTALQELLTYIDERYADAIRERQSRTSAK